MGFSKNFEPAFDRLSENSSDNIIDSNKGKLSKNWLHLVRRNAVFNRFHSRSLFLIFQEEDFDG